MAFLKSRKVRPQYRDASSAQRIGKGYEAEWSRVYKGLAKRYGEMGHSLPGITREYLLAKIGAGMELSQMPERKWKEAVKERFERIRGLRTEPLHNLALMPVKLLNAEEVIGRLSEEAGKIPAYASAGRSPDRARERLVKNVRQYQKMVAEYERRLEVFKALAAKGGEGIVLGPRGRRMALKELLNDVDAVRKHVGSVKKRLERLYVE